MKRKRREAILLSIGVVLSICLIAVIILIPNNGVVVLGTDKKEAVNLNGVFLSVLALVCNWMVCVERKKGTLLSHLALTIILARTVVGCFVIGNYGAIPGMVIIVLTFVTTTIISSVLLKLEQDSVTDLITGLMNRRGLVKELEYNNTLKGKYYMMFVRVKKIKMINDNLGYEYGDEALRTISQRIIKAAGKGALVSKLDGTEFAIALPEDTDIEAKAAEILDTICEKISFRHGGITANYYLSAYAGIASFPDDAEDTLQLVKNADIAMGHALNNERERIVFFDPKIDEVHKREETEVLIKEALENNYFFLVYQPQFATEDKTLRGFETLIRMKLPDGKFVSPGEFIPVAEKTDLICDIDNYVLRRALKEFKDVVLNTGSNLTISVNISAKDISREGFAKRTNDVIREIGFPPECLEIEITEYSLSDSINNTLENITELKKDGIKLALDDFGTGYTSLAQILDLPFDLLKIDKSLIDTLENDEKSQDFISLVIYMGHVMKSEVISEGVESMTQLEMLRDKSCDFIQGYVWSKPLPYEEAVALALHSAG